MGGSDFNPTEQYHSSLISFNTTPLTFYDVWIANKIVPLNTFT